MYCTEFISDFVGQLFSSDFVGRLLWSDFVVGESALTRLDLNREAIFPFEDSFVDAWFPYLFIDVYNNVDKMTTSVV